MTEERAEISVRVLALLDQAAGRRLRLRYLGTDVYDELLAVERVALEWQLSQRVSADIGTKLAVDQQTGGQWVTAREAADLLGVKPRAVRRACADGRITATRPGHDWIISLAEISRYAAGRRRRTGDQDRP